MGGQSAGVDSFLCSSDVNGKVEAPDYIGCTISLEVATWVREPIVKSLELQTMSPQHDFRMSLNSSEFVLTYRDHCELLNNTNSKCDDSLESFIPQLRRRSTVPCQAEGAAELIFAPTGTWEDPLTRSEKFVRVLSIIEAEGWPKVFYVSRGGRGGHWDWPMS